MENIHAHHQTTERDAGEDLRLSISTPEFDYAYSWGSQRSDLALKGQRRSKKHSPSIMEPPASTHTD